jgi:hypothetical protein
MFLKIIKPVETIKPSDHKWITEIHEVNEIKCQRYLDDEDNEWLSVDWQKISQNVKDNIEPSRYCVQVKTWRHAVRDKGEIIGLEYPKEIGGMSEIYLMGNDGQTIEKIQ